MDNKGFIKAKEKLSTSEKINKKIQTFNHGRQMG